MRPVLVSMTPVGDHVLVRRYDADRRDARWTRPTHMGVMTDGDDALGVIQEWRRDPPQNQRVSRELPLRLAV